MAAAPSEASGGQSPAPAPPGDASASATGPPSYHADDVAVELDKIERASSFDTAPESGAEADIPAAHRVSTSGAHHLSLDDVEQVDVQIRGLSVTVDTSPSILEPATYPQLFAESFSQKHGGADAAPSTKTLLRDVSASLRPGTLTAIIGGSGSGKTTLLNTLAQRIASPRLTLSGSVTFNGAEGVHSVRSAYVMQQDVLLPTLTARETLQYSANLRLPAPSTSEERMRVVEEVILELGLKECAETRIGSSQHRGCSGGEKRRVSIGVQLLANPSVLFLDEPTTGLDATSAFQLVRTLKSLARKGRTVVTTIHQPRSEIWDLFDNLVILSRGGPVYSGPMSECLPWFASLGFELPPFVNPAEFVIDIAAIDNRTPEAEEESTARVARLTAAWNEHSAARFPPVAAADTTARKPIKRAGASRHASFGRQLRVLSRRTFKTTYRDPMGLMAAILQAILMGLCCGYIFYNLGRDQAGIRSREGFLYTTTSLEGYLFLVFETYRLTIDIQTFDREHSEGCSDPIPFLLSRRLARLLTEDVPVPFLFAAIGYFMAGLDRDAGKFFIYYAICLVNQYIAVTCAMTCVVACRNFPGASLIANLSYTLQSLACGYFIQSNSIPIWLRWLKWLVYTFYSFGALCNNEFRGSFYDCPYEGGKDNPACAAYTGEYILKSLGFPPNWLWRPIVVLIAFVVFFYTLSAIGLTFFKAEMTIARARGSDTDLSAGKEKMAARSISEVRTIDVGLDQFALALDKRSPSGKRLPRKAILNPIDATFQAGVLNIIMGPSGSGKTSLLNSMALRLHNKIGTRYRPSGRVLFNGSAPSDSVVRSVCSYVCQDDDALLPSLTVRETLRFAAGLRLPSWMSTEDKSRRAEDVLLKMGLKDCADNLIGSDLIKGISGGEKRRVTIAVQVLTDPQVLLLDEPTSGLDAFTANSIMEVLRGLAQEGRTLILTIHQARSDLFRHFGNILLLARGGSAVYAGPASDMLGYFGKRGFQCPQHTNPADFALDLITIDLQQAEREAESRARVRSLIEAWPGEARGSDGAGETPPAEKPASPDGADGAELERRASAAPGPRRSLNKAHLATPAELGALVRKRAPFATAAPLLLRRAFINFWRQPPLLVARIMQVLGLGILLAIFFAPVHHDYYSVQNRIGFVQQISSMYFVGMLQNVAVYPAERDVFYREDDDGVYSAEAFLTTYTLLELPFEVVASLLFGVLTVIAIGFPRTPQMYFVTVYGCFATVSCGESLGIMFNTLFSDNTGFTITLISIVLSVANIMAGILSINMPALFNAFNYLSPTRYAVRAMAPISLDGMRFTCTKSQELPGGVCPISTGEQVLDLYRLNVSVAVNAGALAAVVVVYRLVAWGLLRLARTKWKGKRSGRDGEGR